MGKLSWSIGKGARILSNPELFNSSPSRPTFGLLGRAGPLWKGATHAPTQRDAPTPCTYPEGCTNLSNALRSNVDTGPAGSPPPLPQPRRALLPPPEEDEGGMPATAAAADADDDDRGGGGKAVAVILALLPDDDGTGPLTNSVMNSVRGRRLWDS